MTKPRAPLTAHRAIHTIGDMLGWDEAARIVDRRERSVRNWSDPDTPTGITLQAALMLDFAYRHSGGETAPLLDWYQASLARVTTGLSVGAAGRMERTAAAAIEANEAVAAQILAFAPGAGLPARARAHRETREAIAAFHQTLGDLGPEGANHV